MTKLGIGTKHCLCTSCGEYFTNEQNFDMHRHGPAEKRVCRDPASLLTKSGKRRLVLNARGLWSRPGKVDDAGTEA